MITAITIFVEHNMGDIVYLKTDTENLPRIVVYYQVHPNERIFYELQHGSDTSTSHYAFEITKEKSILIH